MVRGSLPWEDKKASRGKILRVSQFIFQKQGWLEGGLPLSLELEMKKKKTDDQRRFG
jgi:hypothetical protein